MAEAKLTPAPPEFYDRAARIIERYHPHLVDARVEIMVRDSVRSGMNRNSAWAEVDTPNNEADKARFDFKLWFALESWGNLTELQRDALMDHELMHCGYDEDGEPWLAPHDIEEFYAILGRYGAWWPNGQEFANVASQLPDLGQEGTDEMAKMANYQRPQPGTHGSSGAYQAPMPGTHGSSGAAGNTAWADPALTPGGDFYEVDLGNGQVLQLSPASYRAVINAVLADMGTMA